MPDTNDYLSQLLARVDKKLNENEGGRDASDTGSSEPRQTVVFTGTGRFDDVPYSGANDEPKPSSVPSGKEEEAPVREAQSDEREEVSHAEEYPEEAHPQTVPRDLEKTDEKAFSFSPDGKAADQPQDDQGDKPEDVFEWNVSEDMEKYLSSGDGETIFDKMASSSEKKSGRARRAEKRMLKENTRQLMDRNSGAKRGCFGAFFHVILVALLVAFTILAVLYVLQTIADVTIIDINSILKDVSDWVADLIASIKK